MRWINVTVATGRDRLDALEQWLWSQGAVSVTVEDALDKPIFEPGPGEEPVWEEVLVTGLFEDDVALDELTSGVARDRGQQRRRNRT